MQDLEESSVSKQETMTGIDKKNNQNINNDNNTNNGNNAGGMTCHNSPKRLTHIARPQVNIRQMEMKTWLLQILYAKVFAWLNHKNPYTHLTKFYEISGSLGALENEEEAILLRLFPNSLIGKTK